MLRYTTAEAWRTWRARRLGPLHFLRSSPFVDRPLAVFAASVRAATDRPVVVALDDLSPTQVAALIRPAELLVARGVPVVIVAPLDQSVALSRFGFSLSTPLEAGPTPSNIDLGAALSEVTAVLASTHCAGSGAAAWALAREAGAPYLVVQHGVVTPFSPPLPPGAQALAWSRDDANYWSAGRDDVDTSVVGSELLWRAARSAPNDASSRPGATCFLGQLHGAELSRRVTLRTVADVARSGPIVYRPHPGESDVSSRVGHAIVRARGVPVVSSTEPLAAGVGGIVGIFSTGILEGAAGGRRAFAHCVNPPDWVEELWRRYRMSRFGDAQATRVEPLDRQPAIAIAETVGALR